MILVLPTELPLETELLVLCADGAGDAARILDGRGSATGPPADRADAFRLFLAGWLASVDDEASLSSADEPSPSWLISVWLASLSE